MTKRFPNPCGFIVLLSLIALTIGCNVKRVPAGSSRITVTNNPLVALYTIQPSAPATVSIQFGPTTSYGLVTSEQSTPGDGGPVSIFVAGMRANSTYHMRAVVKLNNGDLGMDQDHTFTKGSF